MVRPPLEFGLFQVLEQCADMATLVRPPLEFGLFQVFQFLKASHAQAFRTSAS